MTDQPTTDPSTPADPDTQQTQADEAGQNVQPSGEAVEPEMFPADYVAKLRDENARYRQKAQRADELAKRLLETTIVEAAAGILADPTDLLMFGDPATLLDEDGWPDRDRVENAARQLADAKPRLAARRPRGDIGQGVTSTGGDVDLAAILRSRAG